MVPSLAISSLTEGRPEFRWDPITCLLTYTHWGRDKWPPFCRQHLQSHFLVWKFLYFDSFWFHEICFWGSNWETASIGSDNGLTRNRWHATIYTNDAIFQWFSLDDLTHLGQDKWPLFTKWYFQMHFLEWKRKNFDEDFTGSNQQYSSSGSDNGLAPLRRQAIIWTNGR